MCTLNVHIARLPSASAYCEQTREVNMAPVKPVRVGFIAQSLAILTLSTALVNAQAQPKTPRPSVPALMTAEIENEGTYVWRVRLPPGTTSNFHRHNPPRRRAYGRCREASGKEPRRAHWNGGAARPIGCLPTTPQWFTRTPTMEIGPIEFIYVEFERSE